MSSQIRDVVGRTVLTPRARSRCACECGMVPECNRFTSTNVFLIQEMPGPQPQSQPIRRPCPSSRHVEVSSQFGRWYSGTHTEDEMAPGPYSLQLLARKLALLGDRGPSMGMRPNEKRLGANPTGHQTDRHGDCSVDRVAWIDHSYRGRSIEYGCYHGQNWR